MGAIRKVLGQETPLSMNRSFLFCSAAIINPIRINIDQLLKFNPKDKSVRVKEVTEQSERNTCNVLNNDLPIVHVYIHFLYHV